MITSGHVVVLTQDDAHALAGDILVALNDPDRLNGYWGKHLEEWRRFLLGEAQVTPPQRARERDNYYDDE